MLLHRYPTDNCLLGELACKHHHLMERLYQNDVNLSKPELLYLHYNEKNLLFRPTKSVCTCAPIYETCISNKWIFYIYRQQYPVYQRVRFIASCYCSSLLVLEVAEGPRIRITFLIQPLIHFWLIAYLHYCARAGAALVPSYLKST